LDPATIKAPAQVLAGAKFSVEWTGPDNADDYLTLARPESAASVYETYTFTKDGSRMSLLAPVEPGLREIRYVTGRSKTVLGRASIEVLSASATLMAPDQVVAGADLAVEWTGPKNTGDYITIVPAGTRDGVYRNYTDVAKGSPLKLVTLIEPGPAELRYMTGSEAKVLARRPIVIVPATVSLVAPARAIAGALVPITWEGPNHAGDYVTIVTQDTPDAKYAAYSDTTKGASLKITAPIQPGPAEVRYMSGQGAKVLGRRAIEIEAASITLEAPAEAASGEKIEVRWTGPANVDDYLTIVTKGARDGAYLDFAYTKTASPAVMKIPAEPGPWEVRYVSGQGARVLARREIAAK
jgi:Ca-activated chloride channel family protein